MTFRWRLLHWIGISKYSAYCLMRIAGFPVEKVMIAFAAMYYSEILNTCKMTQRRRIGILNDVLNMDEEIKKLAKYIAPDCNDEGVAQMVEKILEKQ